MKILIIDNNLNPDSWGAPDLVHYATKVHGATVFVRRGPEEDLPKRIADFDRIVISGSKTSAFQDAPWITKLHRLILDTIERGTPLLGVCYGHQALVRALGGKETMRKSAPPELGWTEIERTEDSILTQGLPKKFYSYSSHYEEAASLPPGMKNLARSKTCSIEACELSGKPVFGIQFHPERRPPKKPAPLYDPTIAETLFQNFYGLS